MFKYLAYAGPFLVVLGLILLAANISTDGGGLLAVLGFVLWLARLRRPLRSPDWTAVAAREKEERAQLLQRAYTDARAATELRRRLLEDLKLNELAKAEFGDGGESSKLAAAEVDRDIRQQLERLDAIMTSL